MHLKVKHLAPDPKEAQKTIIVNNFLALKPEKRHEQFAKMN